MTKLCECGECGREVKEGKRFIKGHASKNRKVTWGDKISKTRIDKGVAKGDKNPFANKQHTIESKEKNRQSQKELYKNGYINPMQDKKRPDLSLRNKNNTGKHLEEIYGIEKAGSIRQKIVGRIPWNKDIHQWSDKSHPRGFLGHTSPHKGKTKETSTALKIISEKNKITRLKQKIVYTTSIEYKLRNFLTELSIPFVYHKQLHIKHSCQCDILIPSLNLVLEADGDYWHKYPLGNKIDFVRTQELKDAGYYVLRLWEQDIRKMDINEFKDAIRIATEPRETWQVKGGLI